MKSIRNALGIFKGVQSVDVHLKEKTVTVEYSIETITTQTIKETIEDQGYELK